METVRFVSIIWLCLEALIYIPVGILLMFRSSKVPIKNMSPCLVHLSHWGNYIETNVYLFALYFSHDCHPDNDESYLQYIYQTLSVLSRYCLFLSYVLRGYRVYFIFHLDKNWDKNDSKDQHFRNNIHRTHQEWLLKVFCYLMLPFIVIALLNLVPQIHEYYPSSYCNARGQDIDLYTLMAYVITSFFEELIFIFLVYFLRNVNDDFQMQKELTFVCFLWFVGGFFTINSLDTKYTVYIKNAWRWAFLIRDNVAMIATSLFPLFRTFHKEDFSESLTIEMLQSLDLILRCRVTLDAFEQAITEYPDDDKGPEFIHLWLKCEYYNHIPSDETEKEIKKQAMELNIPDRESVRVIQAHTYSTLLNQYYPMFINSHMFTYLEQSITRQQIYQNRIMATDKMINSRRIESEMQDTISQLHS
ncbi:unnamed protein product [Blepharisma stoltei]|uniref:RGS domain-containing protein n=1 Tax=Blepharisma stoltei TaxID=1481888 RepID=A0AAU9IRJ2_9CILI|nr:unnamed protein product [Blepharisma stoltei]